MECEYILDMENEFYKKIWTEFDIITDWIR